MRCQKCSGLMVNERVQHNLDISFSWRCIICGKIIDEVIIENAGLEKRFACDGTIQFSSQ